MKLDSLVWGVEQALLNKTEDFVINATTTLSQLQALHGEMYGLVDDRNYSTFELLSYLLRHITQLLKAVRKGRHDKVAYHLCMGLSWTHAVANRMHIHLATELWKRFPGRCPYCGGRPCFCRERAAERTKIEHASGEAPNTLSEWQRMLSEIYPNNTAQDSAIHLAEEIGELYEAIRNYFATHGDGTFEKVAEELVDVAANLFGLATCLKCDLSQEMARFFENGCPKCHKNPCECGYVSTDDPV